MAGFKEWIGKKAVNRIKKLYGDDSYGETYFVVRCLECRRAWPIAAYKHADGCSCGCKRVKLASNITLMEDIKILFMPWIFKGKEVSNG